MAAAVCYFITGFKRTMKIDEATLAGLRNGRHSIFNSFLIFLAIIKQKVSFKELEKIIFKNVPFLGCPSNIFDWDWSSFQESNALF